MTEAIRIETDSRGVATLTLTRPDRHNAMGAAVEREVAPHLSVSPVAVSAAKSLFGKTAPPIEDDTIRMTIEALAHCWDNADAREGVSAFFERRSPVFGRGTGKTPA